MPDDHPATADVLCRFVEQLLPESTSAVVACGDSLLAKLDEEASFDLLIQDLSMPGPTRRFKLVAALRANGPDLPIILCTSSTASAVLRAALNARVKGFVAKGSGLKHLAAAITNVTSGSNYIDPSLGFSAVAMRGASTRDICEMTNRVYTTVATHKSNALGKLGLSSAAELAAYIYENGLDFEFDGMPRPAALTGFDGLSRSAMAAGNVIPIQLADSGPTTSS